MAQTYRRPPSPRRSTAVSAPQARGRQRVRFVPRGVVEHPARRRRLREAASWRAVERLVTEVTPSNGWALGLAVVWPQPAIEERIRRIAVQL
ncbi:MAG: hypothetical protein AB1689_19435, partial [Thermodesulfobacteriota bacterium]